MIEIPGFEIRRELGSSAHASVYLALQTSLDREVALKVMAQTLASDAAFSQRFLQEARTLASLAHPNIVPVYDVDATESGQHYFSMQYLPGGDLTERVVKGMTDESLVQTLEGIAEALDYVHQRGLVHRDVRPGNILYDDSNTPILTDFGIARAVGASAGSTGTDFSAETGHYMSPEQARGASLDARADLYSLGALAYFGLVGKPPYDGPDGFAVAYAHVFEPIPRLPAARSHWQNLIDGALAKEPAQRFATARDFIAALSSIATSAPPEAVASPAAMEPAAQTIQMAVPSTPADAPASVAAPKPVSPAADANATVQRPILTQPPSGPAPASAKTTPAKPARVPVLNPPAAPAAKEKPTKPSPKPAPAQTQKPASTRNRWLPIVGVAVAAGVAAIAFVAYSEFSPPPLSEAPVVSSTPAPPLASAPPVVAAVPTTSPAAAPNPPATSPDAAIPASNAVAATTNDSAPKTDATAIPSLDAAAEAAVSEFIPVTDVMALPMVVDPAVDGLRLGRIAIATQRLTQPAGNNALEFFQFVLKRDPKSKAAKQGIVDIAKKYIELADKSQGTADMQTYLQYLTNAETVAKTLDEGADARKDIATRRAKVAEPYLAQAKAAAADWNKAAAKTAYLKVLDIDPNSVAARDGLKFVDSIGEPGFAFRDKFGEGGEGPEVVILGGGRAAIARRDVTRGEFRRFWNAAGRGEFAGKEPSCRDRESFFRSARDRTWQAPGFDQDDGHPVVCVSWAEANAYAQWLGRETGKRYRLLSPAEFDQVAGRSNDCNAANLADASYNKKFESRDGATCDDGFAATAPAGRFEAGSNVRLWVAACGNGGAASAACRDHLAKGRSWMSTAKDSPTGGDTFGNDVALNTVGFRVIREIDR